MNKIYLLEWNAMNFLWQFRLFLILVLPLPPPPPIVNNRSKKMRLKTWPIQKPPIDLKIYHLVRFLIIQLKIPKIKQFCYEWTKFFLNEIKKGERERNQLVLLLGNSLFICFSFSYIFFLRECVHVLRKYAIWSTRAGARSCVCHTPFLSLSLHLILPALNLQVK